MSIWYRQEDTEEMISTLYEILERKKTGITGKATAI